MSMNATVTDEDFNAELIKELERRGRTVRTVEYPVNFIEDNGMQYAATVQSLHVGNPFTVERVADRVEEEAGAARIIFAYKIVQEHEVVRFTFSPY